LLTSKRREFFTCEIDLCALEFIHVVYIYTKSSWRVNGDVTG